MHMDRGSGVRRVKREDSLIIMLTSTKLTWLLLLGFSIKTKICIKVSISPQPPPPVWRIQLLLKVFLKLLRHINPSEQESSYGQTYDQGCGFHWKSCKSDSDSTPDCQNCYASDSDSTPTPHKLIWTWLSWAKHDALPTRTTETPDFYDSNWPERFVRVSRVNFWCCRSRERSPPRQVSE